MFVPVDYEIVQRPVTPTARVLHTVHEVVKLLRSPFENRHFWTVYVRYTGHRMLPTSSSELDKPAVRGYRIVYIPTMQTSFIGIRNGRDADRQTADYRSECWTLLTSWQNSCRTTSCSRLTSSMADSLDQDEIHVELRSLNSYIAMALHVSVKPFRWRHAVVVKEKFSNQIVWKRFD
jgi:hypothetical protein